MYFIWVRSQALNYLSYINEGEVKEGTEGHSTFPSQECYLREDTEILYGLCSGAHRGASPFPNRLTECHKQKASCNTLCNLELRMNGRVNIFFFPQLTSSGFILIFLGEKELLWSRSLISSITQAVCGTMGQAQIYKALPVSALLISHSLSAVNWLTVHGKRYRD